MATRGARIGIAGATGALGSEVLGVLDAVGVPIAQLVAVAGESSLGCDIEFQGEIVPVSAELPALHGLDAFVNCAPPESAADLVRAALRAEVPCIDASGAFALREEVPLVWAAGGGAIGPAPLIASPADAVLLWLPLLRALGELAPAERVTGTVLEAASAGGRTQIEALSVQSLALFNQQELPEDDELARPLAFDCYPASGERTAGRRTREQVLEASLARLLPEAPRVSARWVRIPAFVGQGASLLVEATRPLDPEAAAECLAKAPGVELWSGAEEGPNLRASAGREVVLAGRPEGDPAHPGALRLWVVADVLRLAAVNAVALLVSGLEARRAPDARPH
jgi:aspartate-semialdehyde dehydrogenase